MGREALAGKAVPALLHAHEALFDSGGLRDFLLQLKRRRCSWSSQAVEGPGGGVLGDETRTGVGGRREAGGGSSTRTPEGELNAGRDVGQRTRTRMATALQIALDGGSQMQMQRLNEMNSRLY